LSVAREVNPIQVRYRAALRPVLHLVYLFLPSKLPGCAEPAPSAARDPVYYNYQLTTSGALTADRRTGGPKAREVCQLLPADRNLQSAIFNLQSPTASPSQRAGKLARHPCPGKPSEFAPLAYLPISPRGLWQRGSDSILVE